MMSRVRNTQPGLGLFEPRQTFLDVERRLAQSALTGNRRRKAEAAGNEAEPCRHPVSVLIAGLLSQHIEEPPARLAAAALRQACSGWTNAAGLSVEQIEAVLPDGQGEHARTVQRALNAIQHLVGRIRLDFLARFPASHALAWLERIPGMDRVLASQVLAQSALAIPVLPVGTDYLRVVGRLGLIDHRQSVTESQEQLDALRPAIWDAARLDAHYRRFQRLGRDLCLPDQPKCRRCLLRDVCTGPV